MKQKVNLKYPTRREYTEAEKMEARHYRLKTIINLAQYMSENGDKFSLSATNGKYTLTSKFIRKEMYERGDWLIPPVLTFVNKVRNYVKKNFIAEKFPTQYFEKDVIYMEASSKHRNTFKNDIIEIDIDQAYWETAYQLGVLSGELYNMVELREKIDEFKQENPEITEDTEKIIKRARLIALGALAKKTVHYQFQGKKLLRSYTEHKWDTENIWYSICKRVSDVMLEIRKQLGKDYFFFWVDGIYVSNTPEAIQKTRSILDKYGYKSKTKPIYQIEFKDRNFFVHEELNGRKRLFNYVDLNKKRSYKLDPELLSYCLKDYKPMD